MDGTISRIVADRGFGFIAIPDSDKDLFFHANDLQGVEFDSLHEGDPIEFEIIQGPNGPYAGNVVRGPESLRKTNENKNEVEQNEEKPKAVNLGRWNIKIRNGKLEVSIELPNGTTIFPDGTEFTNGLYVRSGSKKWTKLLRELEDIINDPEAKESELQTFLEENPEFIMSDDDECAIPQATIVTDKDTTWNADFILVPKDQIKFSRILELKLPKEKISLKQKSGHSNYSNKLYKAIRQLKDYYQAFDSEKTTSLFKEKYNTDIFKPDLQLIYGRRCSITNSREFLSFQKDNLMKIKDWDTFLDESKRKFK